MKGINWRRRFHGERQVEGAGRLTEFCALTAVSAISVLFLFYCFRKLSPFIYQTNDDLFLKMLVSGEMCGRPQSRLFYVSFPAGLFLSALYKLLPQVPWYGFSFCFLIGLTMTVILYHLLRLEKRLPIRLLTVLLFGFFCYGFLFLHIAELQFTVVTAIAGSGALFLFAIAPESDSCRAALKDNMGFLLFSACALCIRNQAFFMFLPFIGMIGIGKYLDAGKENSDSLFHLNRQRKCLIAVAGAFTAILALFCLVERLAYQREDWRIFSAYTEASETIYDYEGYPDYEAYEEVYRELGVSRSAYEAAAHHYSITLEPNINQRTMEALEGIVKRERHLSPGEVPGKIREMAAAFLERHLSYIDRPLNLLVYGCYILFFLCGAVCRKRAVLRDIRFLGFARMVIWAYLLFYGRLPSRVSQSVYLAELVVLLAIAFRNRVWEPCEAFDGRGEKDEVARRRFRKRLCLGFWVASILSLTLACLRFGIPKAEAVAGEASSRQRFSQAFADIRDYFHAHPERFYYLDMNSFNSFTEDALEKGECRYDNFLYLGSWMPHSPWYDEKFERAGIADPAAALYRDPNVFAVFMNTEGTGYGYLQDYYAENYPGVSLEIVETVDVSNGIQFFILKGYPED